MYAPSVGSGNTTGSDFLDIDPKLGRVVVFKRLNFLSILPSNFSPRKSSYVVTVSNMKFCHVSAAGLRLLYGQAVQTLQNVLWYQNLLR